MCGINGVVWRNAPPAHRDAIIQDMNAALAHRGPDDASTWQSAQVDFGHRRLSVIDTSTASRQPMSTPDGEHVLVYNGEIYNHIELREQLDFSHQFRTTCDTETILVAYEKLRAGAVDHLRGMFAFAVYDQRDRSLFLARDRLGIGRRASVRNREEAGATEHLGGEHHTLELAGSVAPLHCAAGASCTHTG